MFSFNIIVGLFHPKSFFPHYIIFLVFVADKIHKLYSFIFIRMCSFTLICPAKSQSNFYG